VHPVECRLRLQRARNGYVRKNQLTECLIVRNIVILSIYFFISISTSLWACVALRFDSCVFYTHPLPNNKILVTNMQLFYGKSNGNTRQYRNKIVCVGCTERTLAVSVFLYCFVCVRSIVAISMKYNSFRTNVLQNGRFIRFS
jgi:hypothetical protein